MAAFNPDGVGRKGSLFGLPFTEETASVVILPVPWEVTVSYGAGTAGGPMAVWEASPQIDYFLADIPEAWKIGLAMAPIPVDWAELSAQLRARTEPYIAWLERDEAGGALPDAYVRLLHDLEVAGRRLRDWLAGQAASHLEQGRLVGVLGGDHSTPLGLMAALAQRHPAFGILQIDAHADLRVAYEGFRYSHASIMTNALELPQVSRLVQVGLRDFSASEAQVVADSGGRIVAFTDQALKEERFAGKTWQEQCGEIVAALPQHVYISFDIDALDPKLCPHTGTPVPGGFELEEVCYLIKQVVRSGRRLIGFDLCEVAPGEDEWDGNVGAWALYRLASWAGHAHRTQPA